MTASDSGRRRLPWQAGQTVADMKLHQPFAVAVGLGLLACCREGRRGCRESRCAELRSCGAVEQDVLLLLRQIFEGLLQVYLVALGGEVDELEQILRGGAGAECAVEQRLRPVGDDLVGIEVVDAAEAVALRAGAVGGVEGEAAWLQLGHVEAAIGAGHGGGEKLFSPPAGAMRTRPLAICSALATGRLSEALFDAGLEHDAVDDGLDGVVLALLESNGVGEVADFAVDAGAKSLLIKLIE